MIDFPLKEQYALEDLRRLARLLRSPEGCPWDREQTHRSIRKNFLEETCEALEALDEGDSVLLCEELGDVLYQVVFHALLEEEAGGFSLDDVINGVCRKMVRRHPHVFGSPDQAVGDSGDALKKWETVKMAAKEQTVLQSLEDVPKTLPALMRAQKLLHRAQKAPETAEKLGIARTEGGRIMDRITASMAVLTEEQAHGAHRDTQKAKSALGELLLAAAQMAEDMELDAEEALAAAGNGLIRRFAQAERR